MNPAIEINITTVIKKKLFLLLFKKNKIKANPIVMMTARILARELVISISAKEKAKIPSPKDLSLNDLPYLNSDKAKGAVNDRNVA
mgnify:CR=1 FL=1